MKRHSSEAKQKEKKWNDGHLRNKRIKEKKKERERNGAGEGTGVKQKLMLNERKTWKGEEI